MKHRIALIPAALFAVSTQAGAQTTPTPVPSAPTSPPSGTQMPSAAGIVFSGRSFARTYQPTLLRSQSSIDALFPQSIYNQSQYQQVQEYGRCAANVGTGRSRRALAAPANTRTELVELNLLTSNARSCLPYGYRAPVVFLRGGLAEALYARLPVERTVREGVASPRDLAAFQTVEAARGAARLPDDRAFTRFSNCLTVSAPREVRAVLLSRHGSDAERTAMDAVLAASPGCTDIDHFPATTAISYVRAYLAESAYQWANFQAVGRRPLG